MVQFSLTEEEFDEVSTVRGQIGTGTGSVCGGGDAGGGARQSRRRRSREALTELMSAAGLVRRVGTNLNQAVARLNATGQRGEDLIPAARFCVRVIRRLDETAEHLRRSIP